MIKAIGVHLLIISFAAIHAQADFVYDVDFEAPLHTAGLAPATGPGPNLVTRITTGSPTIMSPYGPLTSQSLHLNASENLTDVQLDLNLGQPYYSISYDIMTENVYSSDYAFIMYLGTPSTRDFQMHGGLNIFRVFQSGGPSGSLGPFSDNQLYHIDMMIDVASNNWTIDIDGIPYYSETIGAPDLLNVQFSLRNWIGGASPDPTVSVYVDNIRVEVIPEPSVGALILVGLGLVLTRRASGRLS